MVVEFVAVGASADGDRAAAAHGDAGAEGDEEGGVDSRAQPGRAAEAYVEVTMLGWLRRGGETVAVWEIDLAELARRAAVRDRHAAARIRGRRLAVAWARRRHAR